MGSSASSSAGAPDWSGRVCFYLKPDSTVGVMVIDHKGVCYDMKSIIDEKETIENIVIYKHPLKYWQPQLTESIINHQFVVIKTTQRWWSIEKNNEGITIQNSSNREFVKDSFKKNKRPGDITELRSANGRGTMFELVSYLCNDTELLKPYTWRTYNCQHFADEIYKKFALIHEDSSP